MNREELQKERIVSYHFTSHPTKLQNFSRPCKFKGNKGALISSISILLYIKPKPYLLVTHSIYVDTL